MGKIRKFLGLFVFLVSVVFGANAFAAGYVCNDIKKYTSCNSGFFLSDCGTTYDGRTLSSSSLTVGNSCKPCSDAGSSYTCSGQKTCPKQNSVTVTYNLNGGSGTTPSAKSCTPGSACSLQSGATTSFYRAGYVFGG